MADIVVLIAKTPADVKALAIVKGYTILGNIETFHSLNKDAVVYSPPYFQPPLGHIQSGQSGAVALASA